ncbi:MAG: hypothetical protein EOO43_23205 [Flavobacterium sp.]|nr:MAG: hypothetical protein EOO43_23205 [Flavobacterium sp.]
MQSDLYNYFINRYQVWGIVQKLLLKAAIINLVSAIEGILMCSIGNLHQHCRFDQNTICKHQSRCTFYIKSTNNMKISGAVDIIRDKLLMNEQVILNDITTLNNIRNNVHLPILLRHEFTNDDYSISNYNKAIKVLKYLKDNQKRCTEEFIQSRKQGCAGLTRP